MILAHTNFKYRDKVLIEKIRIRPPFRYDAVFRNSKCFIYFKEQGPRLLSPQENVQVKSQEAILLKCGSHFLDLIRDAENEEIEVIAIHLYPEVLKELYLGELPTIIERQKAADRSQVVASSDVIARFIDSLEFYFQNPSLVNDDLLGLKIKELILLLVQSKNIDSILELVADSYAPQTVQLKEVIALHLFSNLKLEQLAQLCNLSLSSFKREFKKEFGDSPNQYIIGKRIEKAKELLSLTDLPISEVAYETGFQDQLYFARLFKKKVGITPSSYRSSH
ncbi:MAG: helix-turn-helix domain-containing protein [Bacteroidia bacterium]